MIEAFAAWSLARLLGSIPVTPGGIGVVELSLTGTLVGFGGNNAGVVAAVLVFRFLTMVPTLVLGLIAASTWRRLRPAPGETSAAEPYWRDEREPRRAKEWPWKTMGALAQGSG